MTTVLGIDMGTSGVRASLFNARANETATVKIARSTTDFKELNPDDLVDEVMDAIDRLVVNTNIPIEHIAISTFWHSLLGIDSEGRPTTSLLTWADTRATSIAKQLRGRFDETDIHGRTGCRFHSSYWPAKLLWLQQEQPDNFKQTRYWIGIAEYLCLRLFGDMNVSLSMASATGILHQCSSNWDFEFVRALEVDPNTLPQIADDKTTPRLKPEYKIRWPVLAEASLRAVVGDGAANNIGGGCSTKEKCALMVGTSGAMRVVFRGEPPVSIPPALWSYRVDRERVVVGGALSDGGGLYQWLTESLQVNTSELQEKLREVEADSHGLTVLPFWSGERSTGWTGDARGAILGFTQQTNPVEIVRASLEAIAYRFALIASALDTIVPGAEIVATGNALRSSPVWLQIIADVLGRRIVFGGSPESSIRGAALLALEAVGTIGSIEEVSISVDEVFEPEMDRHVRYKSAIQRQEELYKKLVN